MAKKPKYKVPEVLTYTKKSILKRMGPVKGQIAPSGEIIINHINHDV